MLEFKVKTLLGGDHPFSVADDITLGAFRQLLAEVTNVSIDRQRLIFQGKVLQGDGQKLSELDVSGKVLHLVERPSPEQQQARSQAPLSPHPDDVPSRAEPRNVIMGNFPVVMHNNLSRTQIEALVRRALDRLGDIGRDAEFNTVERGNNLELRMRLRSGTTGQTDSPARARLVHIRQVLRHVNHVLYHLEHDAIPGLSSAMSSRPDTVSPPPAAPEHGYTRPPVSSSNGPVGVDPMEQQMSPLVGDCADRTHELFPGEPEVPEETMPALVDPDDGSSTDANNMTHGTVPQLVDLFDKVMQIQDRMRPHMTKYQELLRDERDYNGHESEGRQMARFFTGVQVALHNISHVYHALSDINIHFCERPPRNLYPQYASVDLANPAEAEIAISFERSGRPASEGSPASQGQAPPTAPSQPPPAAQPQPPRAPSAPAAPFPGAIPVPFGVSGMSNAGTPSMFTGFIPRPGEMPQATAVGQTSVRMEIAPDGSLRVVGASTSGMPTAATTAGGAGQQQSNVVYSSAAGDANGGAQMPGNLIQQLMQGMAAATAGMNMGPAMQGGQSAPPQAPRPQPTAGTTTTVPLVGFPAAHAAGFPPMRRPARMPFARGRGRRGRNSRMFVGRSAIPNPHMQPQHFTGQALNLNDADPLDRISDTMASSAVFMGPRPPTELPLYTLDPYLPCASRHFDPRAIRRRQRRLRQNQANAETQTNQTEESNAAAETETQEATAEVQSQDVQVEETPQEAPEQTETTAQPESGPPGIQSLAGASFNNDDEFVATLEQMLRSVVANMTAEAQGGTDSNAQIYAFQPVAIQAPAAAMPVITGTVTLETRAVPVNVQAPTQPAAQPPSDSAPAPGAPTDVANLMAGVMQNVASGSDQTIGEFVRGMGETVETDVPGFVGQMLRVMVETLSVRELIALMNGDIGPLERNRNQMRRFLIDDVMNSNDRPSDADLRAVSERLSSTRDSIAEFLIHNPDESQITDSDGGAVDGAATLIACEQAALESCLRLIFGREQPPEGSSFGREMHSLLWRHLRHVTYLIDLIEGQQFGYEAVLRRYFGNLTSEGVSEGLMDMVTGSGFNTLRQSLSAGSPVTQDDVRAYFVYKPNPEPKPEPIAEVTEIKMETAEESPPIAQEPTDTEVSWKRTLPEDWVKVVEQDIEKQRTEGVQPPFSDAYINGMPAKRRKMIVENRPATGLDASLRECLSEAVREANVQPVTGAQTEDVLGTELQPALLDAYQTHVDGQLRNRLRSDPDFEARRFPKAQQYFKP